MIPLTISLAMNAPTMCALLGILHGAYTAQLELASREQQWCITVLHLSNFQHVVIR